MTCNLNIALLVSFEAAGNEANNLKFVLRGEVEFLKNFRFFPNLNCPLLVVKLV